MKTIIALFLSFIGWTAFAQFTNVLISANNTPTEPAIIIDHNDTNTLFAATNINNYYVSTDAGATWSENTISSSLGVWGDSSLLIDNEGNLYFFHLSNPNTGSWLDRIVCQKSTDNGVSFNDGSYFGLNGTKDQDKEWAILDKTTGTIYAAWTEFDSYGSNNTNDKTRILFTKSTDSGSSWSNPVKINQVDGNCLDSNNTVEGAVPAIGPNGEIYTAWSGPAGIRFNKSTDSGTTWLAQPVQVDPQPNGWDFAVPGIYRANGLPITLCDTSPGPYNGTIYVNWSDQRNGTEDTDIWLKKSTDGGLTWSELIRVNDDDTGHQQFFTWMCIDQTTGYLYAVFYDRRNHDDSYTDVFLARSTNGGETFTNYKISETPFLPTSSVFFGDYTNITAHNGIIRPIWTSLHNGQLKVWTALINDSMLRIEQPEKDNIQLVQQYPNPANDEVYISFKLYHKTKVNLSLFNPQGEKIALILNNQVLDYGKHIISISLKEFGLSSGLYYYTIKGEQASITKKIIIN